MNKYHRKMCFRPGRVSGKLPKAARTLLLFQQVRRGTFDGDKNRTKQNKTKKSIYRKTKRKCLVFVGCFGTTHFHPGFSSFPCLKNIHSVITSTFPHAAYRHCQSPLSLRFTHAAVKCREHTHERLKKKKKKEKTKTTIPTAKGRSTPANQRGLEK